ncbi:sarcosine oxidase subunit delta [Citricoccus sp. I39-566]|uniref:sarcosine oxidase subunit delta n=1 Tax=Citricoccus sp. I39-566 TaxID=3073268 RepID=UPI00286C9FDF|nr:sarcosine oxidase subunit delta [Citricoccus sp. I39-566]WMY79301.1 sarcosine oxidase subunit delta [Citricoccus sp. I39-566]
MLLIDCPHCGPRNETEFHYGGQAHIAYPEDPHALDDRGWAEYLFYRDNPKGMFAERWQHGGGCRKWFNALRDTHSYEFAATYPAGSPRPDAGELPDPGHRNSTQTTPSAQDNPPTDDGGHQ